MKTTDPFFKVKTLEQVHELMAGVERLPEEEAPLSAAQGRTLSRDLPAPQACASASRITSMGSALEPPSWWHEWQLYH